MWQNVKPACWQPALKGRSMTLINVFAALLYANELHFSSNLP